MQFKYIPEDKLLFLEMQVSHDTARRFTYYDEFNNNRTYAFPLLKLRSGMNVPDEHEDL